jgi:NTE family protein
MPDTQRDDHPHTDTSGLPVAWVLAGGQALGAFQGGAAVALAAAGLTPTWIVGTSIGAVNGAIFAGNAPEDRAAALQRFWTEAVTPAFTVPLAGMVDDAWTHWVAQLQSMMFGSPAVFGPNPARLFTWAWPRPPAGLGLFSQDRLRQALHRLVDFDRLNSGPIRLTAVAVDLASGEEVLFDTAGESLTIDHLIGTCAMPVDYPPVAVAGRLVIDGGVRANLPFAVLRNCADEPMRCIAIDLFARRRRTTRDLAEAGMRRHELLSVSSGATAIAAHAREAALRHALRQALAAMPEDKADDPALTAARREAARPDIEVVEVIYASGHEPGLPIYDWSDRALRARWRAGEDAARDVIAGLGVTATAAV